MKKTLPGSSAVRKAATSALRSSAGPAVWISGASSSAAMMCASEVLPSPGGPASSTWSSASPRRRAASMKTVSWSVTWTWLTKSASLGGLSERSNSSSTPFAPARASWTSISPSSTPGVLIPFPGSTISAWPPPSRGLGAGGAAQGRLHDLLRALALGLVEQALGLRGRVAEVEQAVPGQRARVLLSAGAGRAVGVPLDLARDLLAKLDDDPLGSPLADPRHGLEALGVAGGDRTQQLPHRAAGEGRDRHLRPHPADGGEMEEEVALLLAREA